MKVIIAGSRSITDYDLVCNAIALSGFDVTEVVSGCADGVDKIGEWWAIRYAVTLTQMPANWGDISHPKAVVRIRRDGTKYNVLAGYWRNEEMAKYVGSEGGLILVHRNSGGSLNMKEQAVKYGLSIYEKIV